MNFNKLVRPAKQPRLAAFALVVAGLAAEAVGRMAFDAGVVVHELTPQLPSLEEAFMKMTADSVEFHAAAPEEMAHV